MAAATATNDSLWQTIRDEAQRAMAADPVFGKSLAGAVLVHDDFGAALADLIGRRLGGDATERARFAAFAREAFRGSPELIEAAGRDLQAIVRSDPAIASLLAPFAPATIPGKHRLTFREACREQRTCGAGSRSDRTLGRAASVSTHRPVRLRRRACSARRAASEREHGPIVHPTRRARYSRTRFEPLCWERTSSVCREAEAVRKPCASARYATQLRAHASRRRP